MGLFSGLFEIATTPLSMVADICTGGNLGEEESFTRAKARKIDRAFKN